MATAWTHRAIIIIPVVDQSGANTYFKDNLDTLGGESTFEDELSSSGLALATHYWCDGCWIDSEWTIISGDFSVTYPDAVIYAGENPYDTSSGVKYSQDSALADAGLQRIDDTI